MSSARILILGVLAQRGPKHGYEIRQELESWNAEKWANIAYGSLYFALKSMAEEGLVQPVCSDATVQEASGKTIYEITESGKEEFKRLLRNQWWEIKPIIDPFQVALTFMNMLPKEEIVLALENRVRILKSIVDSMQHLTPLRMKETKAPRHISENFQLQIAHMNAEIAWIESALEKVKKDQLP
ncbi:MAG: PadR family transcriptional regulator [Candidatus Babeliales bacterium]